MAKNQEFIHSKVDMVVAICPATHMRHVSFSYPWVSRYIIMFNKVVMFLKIYNIFFKFVEIQYTFYRWFYEYFEQAIYGHIAE